jgi:hypothetical protein
VCLNFNYIKNVSIPYILHLNNIKSYIRLCEIKNVCDKSPINIIQGKTSYNCNTNIEDYTCKNPLKLYPHGLYACDNFNCNTCEVNEDYLVSLLARDPLTTIQQEDIIEKTLGEKIVKEKSNEEVLANETEDIIEKTIGEKIVKEKSNEGVLANETEDIIEKTIGQKIEKDQVTDNKKPVESITEKIKRIQQQVSRNNKKDDETVVEKVVEKVVERVLEDDNVFDNKNIIIETDERIIGQKIDKKRVDVDIEVDVGQNIQANTMDIGRKIERKNGLETQANNMDIGRKIEKKTVVETEKILGRKI